MLSTGGDLAATNANLSTDFLLVLVALILLFMTVIEYFGRQPRTRPQLPDAGAAGCVCASRCCGRDVAGSAGA